MSSLAHPSDGDLLALLDGELPAARRAEALRHAAECSACNDRLTVLEQSSEATDELLDLLAPPPPALQLDTVLQRARRVRTRRVGLIAAAVTLLLAATAGATVGRPFVRALAARIWAVVHPGVSTPTHGAPAPGAQAGVAVVPGPVAEIVFDTTQASGVVRVSLADTVELAIRSSEPVAYRVYPVGVTVHNGGSAASYDVVIPRGAPLVRIVVAGRVLLKKVGLRISATVAADSAGRYLLNVR